MRRQDKTSCKLSITTWLPTETIHIEEIRFWNFHTCSQTDIIRNSDREMNNRRMDCLHLTLKIRQPCRLSMADGGKTNHKTTIHFNMEHLLSTLAASTYKQKSLYLFFGLSNYD